MRYKAMLIDADNTLFDFNESEKRAIAELFGKYGITDPAAAQAYHEANSRQWKLLERGETTHDRLMVERFRDFIAAMGMDADPWEMCNDYIDALSRQHILIPGALEMVAEVAKHMPVAIVTNGIKQIQKARFGRSPMMEHVKALVISHEEGYDKPDPRLLYIALEKLGGVGAESALMVGDSLTRDVQAAINAGMDACWYNPAGKAAPEGMHIKHIITDIRDAAKAVLTE